MERLFDRDSFYKNLWKLMLPIVFQNLVSAIVSTAELFRWMLLVNAVYCVGKSFNSSLVGGVFCAGGDTRFGLICDAVAMWGVVLPLGFLTAFVWKWPPIAAYIALCMDEFVKLPFVAIRFWRYKWLNNLTRDEKERVNHAEIQ